MSQVRVKLVGAGGYGGIGTIELLHRHPEAEIVALVDLDGEGPISSMWPHLQGICDLPIVRPGTPEAEVDCDVVYFCTPDRVGMKQAKAEVDKGRRVIDFSGDFRSPTPAVYAEYARRLGLDQEHLAPALLEKSAYGVPELHRERIKSATVVANPGCFAVGTILALAPAVREKLIDSSRIVVDAKTGISGAGKKARPHFHYPEAYDNTFAYRLTGHQHVMEMETQLGLIQGGEMKLTFTPQAVPMARGILSSCYAPMAKGVTQQKVLEAYRAAYENEPFINAFDGSGPAGTVVVRGSNRINLTVACDDRTGVFRVLSHIDNLMKGQAGSAVQNMNVMFGLNETAGLLFAGPHP
ncbi:MAG: N-acetyl-gamma-glutamyl-phosphate reductase [Myxococcota bacterium]